MSISIPDSAHPYCCQLAYSNLLAPDDRKLYIGLPSQNVTVFSGRLGIQ